jgi:hypothetical protein
LTGGTAPSGNAFFSTYPGVCGSRVGGAGRAGGVACWAASSASKSMNFMILDSIGAGGMGEVYRARQPEVTCVSGSSEGARPS